MRLRNHEGLHQKEHHPTNHDTISNYHAITLNCNGIAKLQKIAIRLIGLHQNWDGNPDHNLHNRIELRRDCETAKDCQGAERIAPKSRIIHNPRPDQSDFQAICTAIAMQIHNRITINAIRLQSTKSNWIATRLPGDRRIAPKSRDIHKLQPTVPDCPQNRPPTEISRGSTLGPAMPAQSFAIPCNSEDWDRIADSMQSCFDPPDRTQDCDRTPSGKP